MRKARIKVSSSAAGSHRGPAISKAKVSVEKSDSPSGTVMYRRKAQITVRPKTTGDGKPRPKR